MRELLYRRYWDRRKEELRRRGPGVIARFTPKIPRGFIDYHTEVPGTLPEKLLFKVLEERQIEFYYAPYLGDLPFTEQEEHIRPDFILPHYGIIIEVQGVYWHTREGSWTRDYQRALYLRALGWQVKTLIDTVIMQNPYAAVDSIPELTTAVISPSPPHIAYRPADPTAALVAQRHKWPKRFIPKVRRQKAVGFTKVIRAPKRYDIQYGPLFTSDVIDLELAQAYEDWGKAWLAYYPKWLNWWNRFKP